jgi:hypothetical protein
MGEAESPRSPITAAQSIQWITAVGWRKGTFGNQGRRTGTPVGAASGLDLGHGRIGSWDVD